MIHRLNKSFRNALKSRFLRSAGTITGGAAFVQIIALASVPVLTRLYTPESFGLLAVMLGFITFAAAAASLHYEMAIALPRRDEDGASLGILSMLLSIAFAAVSVIVFAPFGLNLLARFSYESLLPYWWLIPVSILGTGIRQPLIYWHSRKQRYKQVAKNGVAQSLAQNGSQILFGLLGWQAFGLLAGLALSRVTAIVGLVVTALKNDRACFAAGFHSLVRVAKDFKTFPTVGLLGAVLHTACFQLPPFILASLFGAHVAGFFMLQDRVLGVPLALLAQGVASVFYVDAAKLATEDPQKLKNSYFRLLRNLTLVGALPAGGLMLLGPWLFATFFGQEWEPAGHYARIMAIPMLLRFVAGPLFRCLTIFKRQFSIVLWDTVGVAILTAMAAGGFPGLSDMSGIALVGTAIGITYAGLLASSTVAVIRNARDHTQASAPVTDSKELSLPAK